VAFGRGSEDADARRGVRMMHYLRASRLRIAGPKLGVSRLPPHHQSHRHLHRPSTSMDFRKYLSKLFKKAKQKLTRGHRKRDEGSGSENDREGRKAEVEGEGRKAIQRSSRLYSEAKGAVESEPSREGNDVDGKEVRRHNPPTPTPSILRSGEPNGM
jgi:hypothetical protein